MQSIFKKLGFGTVNCLNVKFFGKSMNNGKVNRVAVYSQKDFVDFKSLTASTTNYVCIWFAYFLFLMTGQRAIVQKKKKILCSSVKQCAEGLGRGQSRVEGSVRGHL